MRFMHKILAETFSNLEDVNRAIRKISQRVEELVSVQRQTQKLLETAGITLEIDVGDKKSPVIHTKPTRVSIPSIEKLRNNYALVQELYDMRNALEMTEAKLATSFQGKNVNTSKAETELAKLKRQIDQSLGEAFGFLANLAKKHMPEALQGMTQVVAATLERSVVYESATLFSYVFESEGDIVFSNYIHLKNAQDEDDQVFPDLFICCSLRTGENTGLYVAILHKFAPPSKDLLVRKVNNPKDVVKSLNLLLSLDNFENSIGSLPMNVVLKPSKIERNMFSYAAYIKTVTIEEQEIHFKLKPRAKQDGLTDNIVAQLYKELNSIQRRIDAKLRMSVKKAKDGDEIRFYFVSPRSAPPVSAEDLSFLADRFNVDEETLDRVVKVINQGS